MKDVTNDSELSAYFRGDLDVISWPYPFYERLRAQDSVVDWNGGPARLLTRYDDVRAAMAKELPLHNDGYRHGKLAEGVLSRLPEDCRGIFFEIFDFESLRVTRNEGADHQRLRGSVFHAFMPKSLERLRASVQAHVDELIDDMAASDSPDWKAQVADRLPVRIISELFGIPQSDRESLWEFAEAIAAHFNMTSEALQGAAYALEDFRGYVRELIGGVRRTGEGSDLSLSLIEAYDSGALSENELIAMYLVVLFGGTETTTNLLGNGFRALQRFRDQWDLLVANPERVRGALDELLRYDCPLHYLPRRVIEPFELHGHSFAADETVIMMIGAANRDDAVFEDPDRLWLERPNSGKHLAFAYGPHFCLGSALAKMEGEIAFSSLLRRFPEIRMKEGDIPYRGSAMLRAIASLPVELGPDRGR